MLDIPKLYVSFEVSKVLNLFLQTTGEEVCFGIKHPPRPYLSQIYIGYVLNNVSGYFFFYKMFYFVFDIIIDHQNKYNNIYYSIKYSTMVMGYLLFGVPWW